MRNVLLLLSLTLNVFVIGLIAGGHLFGGKTPSHQPPQQAARSIADDPGLLLSRQNIRDLPRDQRRQARKLISTRLPRIRELDREIKQARSQLNDIMSTGDLDKAAAEEAMRDLRAHQHEQQNLISQTMLDFLAQLPDEQRKEVIEKAKTRQAQRAERNKRRREFRQDRNRREQPAGNEPEG